MLYGYFYPYNHFSSIVGKIIGIKVEKKCICVDCKEDSLCGGLWKGIRDATNNSSFPYFLFGFVDDFYLKRKKVHMVMSHCKGDLDWLTNNSYGYQIASIHAISKCGNPVKGAPKESIISVLPNVGRCDYTYAH